MLVDQEKVEKSSPMMMVIEMVENVIEEAVTIYEKIAKL
jgi:hypothetical protein